MSAEELANIFDPAFKVKGGRVSTGNWGLFSSRQLCGNTEATSRSTALPARGQDCA